MNQPEPARQARGDQADDVGDPNAAANVIAVYRRPVAAERFDMDFLVQERIPMVKSVLRPYGLTRITVNHARYLLGDSAEPAPWHCVIILSFASLAGFERALREVGGSLTDSISEFTDIRPVVHVTTVAGEV